MDQDWIKADAALKDDYNRAVDIVNRLFKEKIFPEDRMNKTPIGGVISTIARYCDAKFNVETKKESLKEKVDNYEWGIADDEKEFFDTFPIYKENFIISIYMIHRNVNTVIGIVYPEYPFPTIITTRGHGGDLKLRHHNYSRYVNDERTFFEILNDFIDDLSFTIHYNQDLTKEENEALDRVYMHHGPFTLEEIYNGIVREE